MHNMGRFSIFTKLNNISTIYRKLVYSNVQTVAVVGCKRTPVPTRGRNYSISNDQKSKPHISRTHEFLNGKWVTTEHTQNVQFKRENDSDNKKRKQNLGKLSKIVDINVQLPTAVKRKDLIRFLSPIVYSNNDSFRQCMNKLEKETGSQIKYSPLSGLLTIHCNDSAILANAARKVTEMINTIMNSTEIIPVDLPHPALDPEVFKKLFVGRKGDAAQMLKKKTNSYIELAVVDNSLYVIIHSPDQETLKIAAEAVKTKIQDVLTNTEIIPVDLPHATFSHNKFTSFFVGQKGTAIDMLRKETNANITLNVNDNSLYVVVQAQDQETLKRSSEIIKSKIQDLLTNTEIIPVDLPHATFSHNTFRSFFVGGKRTAIEMLRKETNAGIYLDVIDNTQYVIVHAQDQETLKSATDTVRSKIQDILTNTEIIPVDLPHATFSHELFKSFFVGGKGTAIEMLRKETNAGIDLDVIDNTQYVIVHAQDQETLKSATDIVKSKIQDILTNTEIIPVDLPHATFSHNTFKSFFVGGKGTAIEMLRKETNAGIDLDVIDNTQYVIVHAQDQETLKSATDIVKSKIQDILTNTEIIPVDLPHATFSHNTFTSFFVGGKGTAIQMLRKETNAGIYLDVIDNTQYVIVHAQDQETLKSATDIVKSKIQNILMNTEIIPVDLQDVAMYQDNFKGIFYGRKGATIDMLKKETNAGIYLNQIDSSLYVIVHAQDQETLKSATDIVKSRMLKYQNLITKNNFLDFQK